jgi:NAD(P)-dependent dehydrogenase (short-subunit alcohol dehydrogenase family)
MDIRKCALVTGAGMGIGRGVALVLAEAGYDVAVHYNSSRETALSTCAEIEKLGVRAVPIQADLSKYAELESLFRQYRENFDTLDVYVNNSGITGGGPFMEMTEETFDKICSVNWKGAYFCMQHAANYMAEKGTRGSIVVITSNQQELVFMANSAYGSMKAALVKLCKHAALELAPKGIRVNAIAPGFTDTGAPRMGEKEPTYDVIPLRRWCTPEEIGHLALFLSSQWADSITGACIMMDGGAVLKPALLWRKPTPPPQ